MSDFHEHVQWPFTLRPRTVQVEGEEAELVMWFLGLPDDNLWLIFASTTDDRLETAADLMKQVITHRMLRLILFIGEPWKSIEQMPVQTAQIQTDFMHNMKEESYTMLMLMSLDEVRAERAKEDMAVRMEFTDPSRPENMN